MGWREYAKQVQGTEDNRDNRDVSPPTGPNVPTVPPLDAGRAWTLCRKGVASLALAKPLHNLPAERWRQLLDDARWLLDNFAQAALRDGWTIGELFGLWWWDNNGTTALKNAWGGIADRLQGSRSLKMTADRATWRIMFTGEPDVFLRTAYPDLQPLWEGGR